MKKFLFVYCSIIYKETVILVTGVAGFLLACILPVFPLFKGTNSLLFGGIIIAICFLAANAAAIIKLYRKNLLLEGAIAELKKTITEFDISIKLKEVNYSEKEKYIDDESTWAIQQLKDIRDIKDPTYAGSVNISYLMKNLTHALSPSEDKIKEYLKELQELKKILEEFKKVNISTISVIVTNIGNQYDEDIVASIESEGGVFGKVHELPLFRLKSLPKRPEEGIFPTIPSFDFPIINPNTSKPQNRIYINTEKILKAEFTKLHVEEAVEVSSNSIYLLTQKSRQKTIFNVTLTSIHTKTPQKLVKEVAV